MDVILNRNWIVFVFGFFLLILVFSSNTIAQRDDGPPQRDFSGTWGLDQDNKFRLTVEVQQNGRDITGKASYNAGRRGIARGTIKGRAWTVKNSSAWGRGDVDFFQIEITWHDGVGVYHGSVPSKAQGWLKGTTWPKAKPEGQVTWYGKKFF